MLPKVLLILLACLPLAVQAQSAASEVDHVTAALEVGRSVLGAERQAVIAEAMSLTREQAEQFWPVYREYHMEAEKIMGQRLALIRRFADNYDRMDEKLAESLIRDVLKNDEVETKLKKKYLRRFQKALPVDKLVTYYQLENKIDSYVRASLVDQVPLLTDLVR